MRCGPVLHAGRPPGLWVNDLTASWRGVHGEKCWDAVPGADTLPDGI